MSDYDCFPAAPNWFLSRCCDISPKDEVLCYGAKGNLIFLNVRTDAAEDEDIFRYRQTILAHSERVTGVTFLSIHSDHLCATSSDDGNCRIWNVESSTMVAEMDVGETVDDEKKLFKATTLHSSPLGKGEVIVGNERGSFFRWDFTEGRCKKFSPLLDIKKPHKMYPVTAIACSPHSADIVAIGYLEGSILLFDLTGNGHVIHKLRGHDEEIQSLQWRSPVEDEVPTLASGGRDANIRVWDAMKGMEEVCMRLPPLSRRGEGDQRGAAHQTWTAVAWVPGKKNELVSGGYHGELLQWNMGEGGKPKFKQVNNRYVGHTRMIFNICTSKNSSQSEEKAALGNYAITVAQDRIIAAWDLKNLEFRSSIVTFGGFVYALEVSPMDPTLLAIGCGDNCLRVWRQSPGNPTTAFWNGIRGMVCCINWHPDKEGFLAYGTSDGRVGSLDINKPGKPPVISTYYHRKTVYVVKWGPKCVPLDETAGNDGDKLLFSVGDGQVYQHFLSSTQKTRAVNLNDIIAKTNSMSPKDKFPERTSLSWNLNFTLVAMGNEDGSAEIFSHPHLKLMIRLSGHLKLINSIAWKVCQNKESDGEANGMVEISRGGTLLATGGGDNKVCVFDLAEVFYADLDEKEVPNIYPRKVFGQHKGRVTSLAWSPHEEYLLATASYDGSVQIWNLDPCESKSMVGNFRSLGRVLSVAWDGSRPNMLHSGADDFYLSSWDRTKLTEMEPPLENIFEKRFYEHKKKQKELRRKGREDSKEPKKMSSPSPVVSSTALTPSVPTAVSNIVSEDAIPNGIQESCNFSEGAGESLLADDEIADLLQSKEEELLLKSLTEKSSAVIPDKVSSSKSRTMIDDDAFFKKPSVPLSSGKRPKLFRHTLGMFHNTPGDMQMESLTAIAVFQKCKLGGPMEKGIVKFKESKPLEELVDDYPDIGAMSNRRGMVRLIQNEKELNVKSDVDATTAEHNFVLEFMRGNISAAIDEAKATGNLEDWMVSMTMMASPYLRQKACIAYADQLIHPSADETPDARKAAFYLLACNMVYEAIQVLEEFKFYREALSIARMRLRDDDPMFHRLYVSYAKYQFKNGQSNQGAHCYIAAGEYQMAAAELRKRKDEKLQKAAEYIGMMGMTEPANGNLKHALDYVSNCIVMRNDWLEALSFCLSFDILHEYVPNILMHRALTIVSKDILGLVSLIIPSFPELVDGLKSQNYFEIDVDETLVKAVEALEVEGEEWVNVVRAQIQCLLPSLNLEETRFLNLTGEQNSINEFLHDVAINLAKSAMFALRYQAAETTPPGSTAWADIFTPLCENIIICAKNAAYSLAWKIHSSFFPYGLEEFIPDLHMAIPEGKDAVAKELFFQLAALFDLYGNWWDAANSSNKDSEDGEPMSVDDMGCWLDILLPVEPAVDIFPPDYQHLRPSRSESASILLGYVLCDTTHTKENCKLLLKRIDSLSDAPVLGKWALSRKAALNERISSPE